jgi:hypothetical protein
MTMMQTTNAAMPMVLPVVARRTRRKWVVNAELILWSSEKQISTASFQASFRFRRGSWKPETVIT